MKTIPDVLDNNKNNALKSYSEVNPAIFFISKNMRDGLNCINVNEKICEYCHGKFFSKFNKERHINTIHLKMDSIQNINKQKNVIDTCKIINTFKGNSTKKIQEYSFNKLIGSKRYLTSNLSGFPEKYENKKLSIENVNEFSEYNNKNLKSIKPELKSNTIIIEKISEFTISSKEEKKKNNIHDMIINNIYNILKCNNYVSIEHYFMFQNLIIGDGKYGTVYFGINMKTARPVAIKASNEQKRNNTLEFEITIMQKLAKYKLFSKIFARYVLNNRIFLVETLQGPDINKLKIFCGGKFSITTVYKIGIEILRCLKFIHGIGYLYIDFKDDNIALLCKPIKFKKIYNSITLIDFGFCEKYYKDEVYAPRAYGNTCYSSINALSGNPISRKDDIISLCYFLADLYLGYLPWDFISNDLDKKEETIRIKKNYPFKKICGDTAKELLFIYNDANSLNFSECPNYDNYIYLMENYLKIKLGKSAKDIPFDWDEKITKLIKPFKRVKNLIEHNEEISKLFKGYPNFFADTILENYFNE